jgi:hypothetical protein
MKVRDLTGQRFGRLVVVARVENEKHGKACWLCQCDCGGTIKAIGNNLGRHTTSCGCYNLELISVKGKNSHLDAGLGYLYENYRSSAQDREKSFNLNLEEFRCLTSSNCHYCGVAPYRIKKSRKAGIPYVFNGIDRKDNNIGYDLYNCVPCCSVCNHAKHVMAYDDFIAWIDRLTSFRSLNLTTRDALRGRPSE